MSQSKGNAFSQTVRTILRMWGFAREWKIRFFTSFLIGNTMPLYISILTSYILKCFVDICMTNREQDIKSLLVHISIIILCGIVVYPICFGTIYITHARISGKVQKEIFRHTVNLPATYADRKCIGNISSKAIADFNDAIQLTGYPTVGQNNPFAKTLTITATAMIVFLNNWILGIISFLMALISMIIITSFTKVVKENEYKVKMLTEEMNQNIVNTLAGTVIARVNGFESYLEEENKKCTSDIYSKNNLILKKKSTISAITNLQGFLSFTVVMLVGLILASHQLITIANVIFIANLQIGMVNGIVGVGQSFINLQKFVVAAERLFKFFDEPEENQVEGQVAEKQNCKDAISLKNIGFQYSNAKESLFTNFSLSVPVKKKIALVGSSGSGKSTLFKLLLRFEEINSGTIELFGNDYKKLPLKQVRNYFSYVPQESYLFNGTIEDNIAWGSPGASKEEIYQAAKAAYLDDFIESLPNRYQTIVGERGTQLSGGQRQRIAIARAFLKNSKIILLDEATSALDSKSEDAIKHALDDLMKDRTSIIIAHRLSTIQNVDKIFVIEEGRIKEEGSHLELLRKQGRYAQLYAMQYQENVI